MSMGSDHVDEKTPSLAVLICATVDSKLEHRSRCLCSFLNDTPRWGTADAEIKGPPGEIPELSSFPL